MKYFSPSYWFKLWVLSAPLFQDKPQGINAMSIDNNQKIKDWASNNTNLQSINQELNFTNNTISNSANNEIDHFYENFLKTQGWSKNPQIAGQQLIEIQEEHHHFLEAQHENIRIKRQPRNNNRYITTSIINVMLNDEQGNYSAGINNVIRELINNDIIRELNHGTNLNHMYYLNEDSNYQYLIIPINVIMDDGQHNTGQIIELVFRTNNLYLNGFSINSNYYHFADAEITTINNINRITNLTFISTYRALRSSSDTTSISWNNIFQAFNDVIDWNRNGGIIHSQNTVNLRNNLSLIILATSESLRFETVTRNVSNTSTIRHDWNWYSLIINHWDRYTGNIINYLNTNGNLVNFGSIVTLGSIRILNSRATIDRTSSSINTITRNCLQNNHKRNRRSSNNILYCINIGPKKFYWTNGQNKIINFSPSVSLIRQKAIFTFNLGNINPVDNFNRLDFLGDTFSDNWGVKIKWGSWIYDGQHQNHLPENTYSLGYYMSNRNYEFHDIIKNSKVFDNISPEQAENYTNMVLQNITEYDNLAWVEGMQKTGLTWYWENENYYLQFIVFQYLNWQASYASLDCWLKIGSGIKLYSENSNRKKRNTITNSKNITNIKSDSEKIINNENKFNDSFINSINHEQHLPTITNKTNYISNNITNL